VPRSGSRSPGGPYGPGSVMLNDDTETESSDSCIRSGSVTVGLPRRSGSLCRRTRSDMRPRAVQLLLPRSFARLTASSEPKIARIRAN
jgi:hypothetical protein